LARCVGNYRHTGAQSPGTFKNALVKWWGSEAVKKKVRAKMGWQAASARTSAASDIRSTFVDDNGKLWRWIVDDRMRDYGDIDFERRVIRINHAIHKRERESLIDTLFHEELHRLFPNLGERAICAMTQVLLPTLSAQYRSWLYSRIRRRQ
jgi:hypothetical protein